MMELDAPSSQCGHRMCEVSFSIYWVGLPTWRNTLILAAALARAVVTGGDNNSTPRTSMNIVFQYLVFSSTSTAFVSHVTH